MSNKDTFTSICATDVALTIEVAEVAVTGSSFSATENSFKYQVAFLSCVTLLWVLHSLRRFMGRSPVPKGCRDPPTLMGAWIPFVGSGPELSRDSIAFLNKYHKSHGHVFQTKIGLSSAYFVKDVHFPSNVVSRQPKTYSMHEYFREKTIRLFNVEFSHPDQLKSMRKWAHKHVLGENLDALTHRFSYHVHHALLEKAACMREFKVVNLFDFTNPLVFDAATRAFFGNYDSSLEAKQICQKTLFYDDDFVKMASGLLPEMLFKSQRKAQHLVGQYLTTSLERHEMTDLARDLFGSLGRWYKDSDVAFMFAWALSANSLPTIFWMLIFLLRNDDVREQVLAQVHVFLNAETGWDAATATEFPVLTTDIIKKMTLMESMMWETLRKRSSVNLTRAITKDTVAKVGGESFFLRKGNLVICTNPHHDPAVFPEPEIVVADRFLKEKTHTDAQGKKVFLPNQAFGHGISMCPGSKFALMEGPAMVVMMLTCFDWEPVAPESNEPPPPNFEKFGFGCMPLHPDYHEDPSIYFRVRVKPQFL